MEIIDILAGTTVAVILICSFLVWVVLKIQRKSSPINPGVKKPKKDDCNQRFTFQPKEKKEYKPVCKHEWKLYNYPGRIIGTCQICRTHKIFSAIEASEYRKSLQPPKKIEPLSNYSGSIKQSISTSKPAPRNNAELIEAENRRRSELRKKRKLLTSKLYKQYRKEGKQHAIARILAEEEAQSILGWRKNDDFSYNGASVKDPLSYFSGTAAFGRILK